jgi:hypothetical protein
VEIADGRPDIIAAGRQNECAEILESRPEM